MSDPFMLPVPTKLANDPELAPYFNFLNKVLHDLTATPGTAIASPTADVAALKVAVDAILAQMVADGVIVE